MEQKGRPKRGFSLGDLLIVDNLNLIKDFLRNLRIIYSNSGQLRSGEEAVDFSLEVFEVEGLLHEDVAAEPFGLVNDALIDVAGVHNDLGLGGNFLAGFEDLNAGHVGEFHVEQKDVGFKAHQGIDSVFSGIGGLDLIALLLEIIPDLLHNPGLIIDNEKFFQ